MTTEQMDWLDDEAAGRHAPLGSGRNPYPKGLTVSEDGSLLNWLGENYVRQTDLRDSEPAFEDDGLESHKWAGEEATQAEEPIDHRLRRAWLNGYGEGFNRGSWGDQRWDR